MNKITFPLSQGDRSQEVADLQDAMLELVNREALLTTSPPRMRQQLLNELRRERANQSYGAITSRMVQQFQEEKGLRTDGAVGAGTAAALNALLTELGLLSEEPGPEQPSFEVRGRVSLADGSPAVGLKVLAVDRDLRREQPLGEAQTDRNGGYHIRYSERQFQRAEKGRADLIVRVLGPDGGVMAASEILFNAPESTTMDLVIAENVLRPDSEFERIDSELAPLLDGVPFAELTAEDIAFLAGETGIDAQHLGFFATSHRLATATGLPAALFYGLARQGYPTALAPLLVLPSATLRSAIEAAIEANQVPRSLQSELDAIFRRWQALVAQGTPEPGRPFTPLRLEQFDMPVRAALTAGDRAAAHLQAGLNEFLRSRLTAALSEQGHAVLAAFAQTMPEIDLTAQADQDLRSFMRQQTATASATGRGMARTLAEQIETLSTTTTVADLLGLDQPVRQHPSFRFEASQLRLAALLATDPALAEPELQTAFVERYRLHEGDIADFWQGLREDPAFEREGIVESLQRTLRFTHLTRDSLPLTRVLQGLRGQGEMTSLRDLARLKLDDWRTLIQTASDAEGSQAIPAAIPGADEDERRDNYAQVILADLETAFPTDFIATELDDDPGLKTFFTKAPEFRFEEERVVDYLATHGEKVLADLSDEDRQTLRRNLSSVQRLFQVTPKAAHIRALREARLDSAYSIVAMPRKSFLATHADRLGGEETAAQIYRNAERIATLTQQVFVSTYQARHDVLPFVMGGGANNWKAALDSKIKAGSPTLALLFGSLDLCACEHCQSLYGPAAYFVELLQFLGGGPRGPRSTLLQRRPDLAHIRLNCDNAMTTMPYVDLVNEVLEYAVAHNALDEATARNTEGVPAAELKANPQYVIDAAYEKLKEATYPIALPFDRDVVTARAYLEHLGSSRHEVMRLFLPDDLASKERRLDAERLGLTAVDYEILTRTRLDAVATTQSFHLRELHGHLNETVEHVVGSVTETHLWYRWPILVRDYLQTTGLTYEELVDLLATRFVNPAASTNDPLEVKSDTDGCDLDSLRLEHHSGEVPDSNTRIRLLLFIRLWRKLGWSLIDLDRAVIALGPATTLNDDAIAPTFLHKLASVQTLQQRLALPLDRLFSLWADIGTHGEDSLYARLFLNRAAREFDEAFKRSIVWGTFLPSGADKDLSDHASPLLSAFRISAAELDLIRADAGLTDTDNARLTLANVSLLFRYTVLAKGLRWRIADLIALKQLSGVEPFGTPDQTAAFVALADQVRASGFSLAQLTVLCTSEAQVTAPVALAERLRLAAQLRTGLATVAADTDVPEAFDLATTRARLEQVLAPELAERFTTILQDAVATCWTTFSTEPEAAILAEPRLRYDRIGKRLGTVGALSQPERDRLRGLSDEAAYQEAIDKLFADAEDFRAAASILFDECFGSLLDSIIEQLLSAPDLTPEKAPVPDSLNGKCALLLNQLLPFLRNRLSRRLVTQTLAETLSLEPATVAALLEREALLAGVLDTPARVADMPGFLDLAAPGLTATWYNAPNLEGSGEPATVPTPHHDSTDPEHPSPIPPTARSASWEAWLLAPNSEDYRFTCTGNVVATLTLDGEPVDLLASDPIRLEAGRFYQLRLEAVQLDPPTASLALSWQSQTIPRALIPAEQLYPQTEIDRFVVAMAHLQRAALLITGCRFSPDELDYLAGADFQSTITAVPSDEPQSIFKRWRRFQDYVSLRDRLPHSETRLIDLFATASRASTSSAAELTDELIEQLRAVTGWTSDLVPTAWLRQPPFAVNSESLRDDRHLRRLEPCVALARRIGIALADLGQWALGAPAQQIKDSVRAKYDSAAWYSIAGPLNDRLRAQSRDALLVYLLRQPFATSRRIATPNDLYAHLLIDVEMSPCMMTSRLKQAVASVQLFVQRCLMNLEPEVHPETLDDDQWAWMSRYRVWEANRKVFLYPENWIEPELRDDKTPFFRELEAELLQNDLTPDYVESLFLNYLKKLDEVARLDICGMYWEGERDGRPRGEGILHVFGRTFNAPHKYFYRRWLEGEMGSGTWTAWEALNLNIESGPVDGGVHLIPVVFNRRLYLFWPVFTEKPDLNKTQDQPKTSWEIQLAWSERWESKWLATQQTTKGLSAPAIPARECTFFFDKSASKVLISCYVDNGGDIYKLATFEFSAGPIKCSILVSSTYYETAFPGPAFSTIDFMGYRRVFLDNAIPAHLAFPPQKILYGDSGAWRLLTVNNQEHLNSRASQRFFFDSDNDAFSVRPVVKSFSIPHAPDQKIDLPPDYKIDMRIPEKRLDRDYWLDPRSNVPIFANTTISAIRSGPSPAGSVVMRNVGSLGLAKDLQLEAAPHWEDLAPRPYSTEKLRFELHYHPRVCKFIETLSRDGIPGLLTLKNQQSLSPQLSFAVRYQPNDAIVAKPHPVFGEVDFEPDGAYSVYNWELFFHIPLLIATRLMQDQRFAEARIWFHYIFNPTSSAKTKDPDKPWQRYWNLVKFRETEPERITALLRTLSDDSKDPVVQRQREVLQDQIADWRDNPFQPHRLARLRLQAYQKSVVMKYIDNLIQWGDRLFRQDTIESINEATQLYLLAQEILGPRPQQIPTQGKVQEQTYADLHKEGIDMFSNALVPLEDTLPPPALGLAGRLELMNPTLSNGGKAILSELRAADSPTALWQHLALLPGLGADANEPRQTLYFCIPQNDNLLAYWDRVGDRLFKIRHCMNIEGVVRELPLYEPPIDPALLVQAAAKGIDIGSVLDDLNAPLSVYRFEYLLPKALELCAEVKVLGGLLLSVLEKRDAEALSNLRASHEVTLLKLVRETRLKQKEEAVQNKLALEKTRAVTAAREAFYAERVKETEENRRLPEESGQLAHLEAAQEWQEKSQMVDMLGGMLGYMPNFTVGAPTTVEITWGSSNLMSALGMVSRSFSMDASRQSFYASRDSILGQWARRAEDWALQHQLALKELEQIDAQITAADIRIQLTERELATHDRQIEQATAVEEFLRDKFTNQELYAWMKGRIAGIFFQTYKLAYDQAKRAEKALRYEHGLASTNHIKFGYWDSLRQGLLAGEQLHHDLKRLEVAHLDKNRRHYELTRHISLSQLDPLALIALRTTGRCTFELPEALFDMDCPGHYFRRIKTVAVSIPCVTGPYASVNCTLTLLKSSVRTSATTSSGYKRNEDGDKNRFRDDFGSLQSIVTSSAQNDSGLFEANLHDQRYLPFEGAGADSEWRLELPDEYRQFNYDSISDVILHLRYTAREGGSLLRSGAISNGKELIAAGESSASIRLFSVRHEFPREWHRFKTQAPAAGQRYELALTLRPEHYPFWAQTQMNRVSRINLLARSGQSSLTVADSAINGTSVTLANDDPTLENLFIGEFPPASDHQEPTGEFKLYFDSADLSDLWIAVSWTG